VEPCRRHQFYARVPRLVLLPLFVAETPWRLAAELASAFPDRALASASYGRNCGFLLDAPLSFKRMPNALRLSFEVQPRGRLRPRPGA